MRDTGADLVHAHLPSAGILARLFSPAPVVYTEHNLTWTYRAATRALNRVTYGRNAAVTAVSQAVADSVARYPGPEVEVVPNGVTPFSDPYGARRARRELGLGHQDPLVVHVGNIRPGKGHALLIEAARELLELRPGVTVVSIGAEKYPGGLADLRRKTDAMGFADRMIFLGRRPDARDFIATADVYVNPADFEGLPVTILEAMAAFRPVVATSVGGVPSVIEDGVTGRLVAPGSASGLAKAIDALLEDKEGAERMGRAAEATVKERFGLEPMIRAFENIYSRVLG
jgi:glycosyltransferase involved in cell wall biosynthesis